MARVSSAARVSFATPGGRDGEPSDRGKRPLADGDGVFPDKGKQPIDVGHGGEGWTEVHRKGHRAPRGDSTGRLSGGQHRHTTWPDAAARNRRGKVGGRPFDFSRIGPSYVSPRVPRAGGTRSESKMPAPYINPIRVSAGEVKRWRDLVAARSTKPSEELEFFPPKEEFVAVFDADDEAASAAIWRNTLVGYVLGPKPFFHHLKAAVGRLWRPRGGVRVFSRENGYFFFKFDSESECDRILQDGPWLFDSQLIVLKKWSPAICLDRDVFSSVPIWIKFPFISPKF